MSTERSPFQGVFNKVGQAEWILMEHLKMRVEGLEELRLANEHLGNGGRVQIIHPHPGTFDPGYILRVVYKYLDNYKSLGYPASSKMSDGRMPMFKWAIDYLKSQNKMDEVWPVIQDNDEVKLRKVRAQRLRQAASAGKQQVLDLSHGVHRVLFPSIHANHVEGQVQQSKAEGPSVRLNDEIVNQIIEFFANAPSPVLCICPEGTRSTDGVIHDAKEGPAMIFGSSPTDTLLLPIAIEGSEKVHQKGQKKPPNFFAEVKVRVGTPRTLTEVENVAVQLNPNSYFQSMTQAMMLELIALMPPRYWGDYTKLMQRVIKETGDSNPQSALEILRGRPRPNLTFPYDFRQFVGRLRSRIKQG